MTWVSGKCRKQVRMNGWYRAARRRSTLDHRRFVSLWWVGGGRMKGNFSYTALYILIIALGAACLLIHASHICKYSTPVMPKWKLFINLWKYNLVYFTCRYFVSFIVFLGKKRPFFSFNMRELVLKLSNLMVEIKEGKHLTQLFAHYLFEGTYNLHSSIGVFLLLFELLKTKIIHI